MPSIFPHACKAPGCPGITRERYCEKHKHLEQDAKRQYDQERGTAAERGYGARWQKARLGFLRHHPLCAECERRGLVTAATVVDHNEPHRGDMARFWDPTNWQSLCTPCHNVKTAREDGAFGNQRKDG